MVWGCMGPFHNCLLHLARLTLELSVIVNHSTAGSKVSFVAVCSTDHSTVVDCSESCLPAPGQLHVSAIESTPHMSTALYTCHTKVDPRQTAVEFSCGVDAFAVS